MRGVFKLGPSWPENVVTWDTAEAAAFLQKWGPAKFLSLCQKWGPAKFLSLCQLTLKVVMHVAAPFVGAERTDNLAFGRIELVCVPE